jgi:hypothetical protein
MEEQVTFFCFPGKAETTDLASGLQVVFALDPQGRVLGAGCAQISVSDTVSSVSDTVSEVSG